MYGGSIGFSDISVLRSLAGPDSWLGRGPLDLKHKAFFYPQPITGAQPLIPASGRPRLAAVGGCHA